jgi:hypothetical protein
LPGMITSVSTLSPKIQTLPLIIFISWASFDIWFFRRKEYYAYMPNYQTIGGDAAVGDC